MKSLNINQIGKSAGILVIGLLLGWLFFGGSSSDEPQSMNEHVEEAHTNEQGEVVYTCSMHPSVRESEPGNCPICGMELIPVNQEDSDLNEENPYQLTMTEEAKKLAQIQTTEVTREVARVEVRMPGKVMVDERRIRSLPSHFPGRIEQLYVNFTGEYIEKGQKVASIYSPALVSAQKELLEAMKHKEQSSSLYKAARAKLLNWKISESQIQEIERTGEVNTQFDITSHMGGYIITRNIAVGDHVEIGTVMYQMADLSTVWVVFNAYEKDLAVLNTGDDIRFTVESYSGETFEAKVTYIDPTLDSQSRTVKVRSEVQNKNGRLKPQMLAEGVISSVIAEGREQTLIPKSAVLWTGERSVVYVQKPDADRPTFEFREIELGPRVGDRYVIRSGVKAGEKVVTNGNFKIDSAAQLAGKASMMNKNPAEGKPTREK
ncbi:efflux RND transporter periplasmic adaptor subunit [Fodinibius sp. Rm-B-1B1-1]|uniref:efflux RND transporter periplasmic adaptor subunit n=1 Tax=Fodinibius alkaliphilus TaxID=3140241 RepID=UPI00315B1CCF